ncbi:MAG: methyltransferase domain-containing protein [Chloroflexi bacterium]|nr:methyltransferase domain-containing protein [Chloroflexota bacterium]
MTRDKRKPTIEDVLELSGIELLHPGGFDITRRIGEIVEMKGKKVLDVSCGRGILPAYYAKNFGARIVGVDLSPEMIRSSVARAKREGVESQTEFKVANSLDLPFEDCSFDLAVNECAVGLTPDPQKCLDEMARVTKPGGYVVIHESTWLKEMGQPEKADIARRLGTVPYTLAEWKGMMASAGLTDLWAEDWSAPENAAKIRPDRKVKNANDLFSLWEMLSSILPRLIFKYGITSIGHIYESMGKVYPLYLNGTLGYFLLRGQKP